MCDMNRTVDEVEQALADILANYSVDKGNGWEPMPYLRAYYQDVLGENERPVMVKALRRWLSPEQFLAPRPGQPATLWWTARALASDLNLTDLVPDLVALADVAEPQTPPPEGLYTAKGLREAAARISAST
jgi:hypothetical protein